MEDAQKREVTPPRPSLMALATAVAPWTHIEQIRLVRSSIESVPIDVVESSWLEHSFDAATTVNQEAGSLEVRAFLAVSVGEFLRIDAEFLLNYSVDKNFPVPAEFAAAFGKMNGIHNIWPYWREYVQSTSARAGMPPVIVPLMTAASMTAYYAEKEKETLPTDPFGAAESPTV